MIFQITLPSVKFFFSIFILSFLSGCSQPQENNLEPFRIPLSDLTNSKAEITYTHQKIKNGQGRTGEIKALLEIKAKSDEGFIASWTSKSVQVNGVLIDESNPQAGSMLLGVPFDFSMGADGEPIKLLDSEKLFEELPNSAALIIFQRNNKVLLEKEC